MGRKGFSLPLIILFVTISLSLGVIAYLKFFQHLKPQTAKTNTQTTTKLSPQDETTKESNDKNKSTIDKNLEHFLLEYPKYAEFKSNISKDKISRAFSLGPIKESKNVEGAWLVEVEHEPRLFSYYLLTPLIQVELEKPMGCGLSSVNAAECKLDKFETISGSYLIMTSTNCQCAYFTGSYSVSIFRLSTGNKIKFIGDNIVKGTGEKCVSNTGNALGQLRGVFGTNDPTVVIDYGLVEAKSVQGIAQEVYDVHATGYFDLETGNLKNLVEFK